MDKHLQNIIAIFFIVIISLFSFTYWLDLKFGYGQFILSLAGGYGIYLNFKSISKGEKQT